MVDNANFYYFVGLLTKSDLRNIVKTTKIADEKRGLHGRKRIYICI